MAGLTLKDPVFIDACDESLQPTKSVPVFHSTESNILDTAVLPESLIQKYVVTPAKLRLVTLASLILWKCKVRVKKKNQGDQALHIFIFRKIAHFFSPEIFYSQNLAEKLFQL